LSKFRATPQRVKKLWDSLQLFEGTKCFHSSANGKIANDKGANRYIISFETQDPIILKGMEWIPTRVVGQFFILHQILKMISRRWMWHADRPQEQLWKMPSQKKRYT
jgi:tRNA pseudouridine38-40 synthase